MLLPGFDAGGFAKGYKAGKDPQSCWSPLLATHPPPPPLPADSRRSVGGRVEGLRGWAGSFLLFPPAAPWPGVRCGERWQGLRWAHPAVGGSPEQPVLRRAVGGGEWGLALAGKLISFGCRSPHNQCCMLSGRRQQRDSGQTQERGLDLCAARRTPEASPDWDKEP